MFQCRWTLPTLGSDSYWISLRSLINHGLIHRYCSYSTVLNSRRLSSIFQATDRITRLYVSASEAAKSNQIVRDETLMCINTYRLKHSG